MSDEFGPPFTLSPPSLPPSHPDTVFKVRPAKPSDRAAMFRVCLETGDSGADATLLYSSDPEALGKRWVGPYIDLEPQHAFVLERVADGAVCGYTLGALDTSAFMKRLQEEYVPPLRLQVPDPNLSGAAPEEWSLEEQVYAEFHDPQVGQPPAVIASIIDSGYPSQLHIDLVAAAQGCGQGVRMMAALLASLQQAGSRGVHLQMHAGNARAKRFYEKLGFTVLNPAPEDTESSGTGGGLYMGLRFV